MSDKRSVVARRTFIAGLASSTGLTLGFAACAPLLAWLVTDFGWRMSFILISPLGLAASLLWWWYVRDRPVDHPATNGHEVALIRKDP